MIRTSRQRAATRGRKEGRQWTRSSSSADMIAKLKIVEEEADETLYWLELLVEAQIMREERLRPLMVETDETLAMTVVSIKTLRKRS